MAENENNLPAAADNTAGEAGAANEMINNAGDVNATADDAGTTIGEATVTSTQTTEQEETPVSTEEITYHAVEKDGHVTAIWEMQGRKHLRTIDPRSRQGQEILRLYTSEHHDEAEAAHAQDATATQDAATAQ